MSVLGWAALVCTALALLGSGVVLVAGRRVQPALGVLLDLLLAAGLLRLADDPDWAEIAVAAAVVALRSLVRVPSRSC